MSKSTVTTYLMRAPIVSKRLAGNGRNQEPAGYELSATMMAIDANRQPATGIATMQNSEVMDNKERPNSSLATAETRIGFLLLAALLLHHALNVLGVGLDLEGMLGLLPLLLMFIGFGFLFAGGMLRRFPDNPVFCNIPLLLSLAVLVLTFL